MVSVIALGVMLLAIGLSGVGGPAMSGHPFHVALEDGAVSFYVTQLVSLSFFRHTASLRFVALPGLAVVAVAIATSAMVAVRRIGGSVRRRMLVAMLIPIPYALLAGLGARYLTLHLAGPVIGRDTVVVPASAEAFLLPLVWGMLFAPVGGLVGVFGRSWRRDTCQILGVWATPVRCSLRALGAGLAMASIVVVLGATVLVAHVGGARLLAGGGFGHDAAVIGGLLLALPTVVLAVFLACFGVSFDWRVEALSRTQGSGSTLGGTLPTLGTPISHQVPALFALLLVLGAATVLLAGWLAARRTGVGSVTLGLANAVRAGSLLTLICWLFALVARVDAQAGGYLGAHFQVDVGSLLWRVPLFCVLGSLAGSVAYVASRGASVRRDLAVALLALVRPSRPREGWLDSWRQGLASRAVLGASVISLPAILIGIGSAAATTATGAATPSLAPISQAAEQRLRPDIVPGSRLSVAVEPSTRVIDSANVDIPLAALGVSPKQSPIVKAQTVLGRYGKLFGIGRSGELGDPQVMTEPTIKRQHIGMTHVYFKQMAAGVPVFGGSIGVHLADDDTHVDFVSGSFIPEVEVAEDNVAIKSAHAVSLAKVALPAGKLLHQPRLEVYTGVHPVGPSARLAWFVWLTGGPLRASKEYVVDAINGSILHVFNKSFNVKEPNLKIYSAEEKTGSLPGTLKWENKDAEPTDKDTKEAKKNIESALKFFNQEVLLPHCVSTNCKDGAAVATVHYGTEAEYKQAEWNPQHEEIVFGNGFPEALDIVGHEFSQGVTENVTGEINEGQTGALNEGWADAMGKALEAYTKRSGEKETWAEPSWLVGEKEPGGAIRNLKEPKEKSEISGHPDPEKLSQYVNVCQDNDDIHENSTIISHAFYLLSTKLGIQEATRVFYRMQMLYLVDEPTATLEMAAGDAERSAEEPLWGRHDAG